MDGLGGCDLQTSSYKPNGAQQLKRKCLEYQQEVFYLQD
jgi:hypothetical protein